MSFDTTVDAARATAAAGDEGAVADDSPFRARRERFLEAIGEGVAVICAAPELIKSRDTEILFRQNSDLFYLTGFREPAVAVFTPHDAEHRFTLFVRPRDPEKETWNGPRAGVDGAKERFGADAAYPLDELDSRLKALVEPADALWYALGSNAAMDRRVIGWLREWRLKSGRSGKGPSDVLDPARVLDRMRVVKEPREIEALRRACEVSARGHLRAMRMARPGVGEWELAAALDAEFRAEAAGSAPAYPSIVGSGANATILHYTVNDRRARDGDLVLIDAGAEVGMYCGDITRTFPVNGRFTPAQRRLYDAVLAAEEAAIAMVRPGVTIGEIHDATRDHLTASMIELGLLSGEAEERVKDDAFKRYYMHQSSHWLGLDVHDAGHYKTRRGDWLPLEPGMVFTIEPGLYVAVGDEDAPEELRGLGVRIEDDVLVTETGCEILTRAVPVAPDAIEALVGADHRASAPSRKRAPSTKTSSS